MERKWIKKLALIEYLKKNPPHSPSLIDDMFIDFMNKTNVDGISIRKNER